MQEKTAGFKLWLAKAGISLYVAIYTVIFIIILFFNTAFGYMALLQCILLCLWLGILGGICLLGRKHAVFLIKHKYKLLGLALTCLFTIQLFIGLATRQEPMYDYEKIYNGAITAVTSGYGTSFEVYNSYLHHFTNNVGGFIVLRALFGVLHIFGLSCYYDAMLVLGHLFVVLSVLFTFLYLDKAFGSRAALLSLVFYAAFLPVYFQSSVVYTDTLSIFIPPLLLYLYQQGLCARRIWSRLACHIAMGALAVLGYHIKATVVITLVALIVQAFLSQKGRPLLTFLLAVTASVLVFSFTANLYIYSTVLDKERAQQESMPLTLWVLMGMAGDGAYNEYDHWGLTTLAAGKQARAALHWEEIQNRLEEMGPGGYLQLLHRKTSRTFGSGSADLHWMLGMPSTGSERPIFQFISADGRYFKVFNNLTQCVYLSFYILGIAGTALALRRGNKKLLFQNASQIALIGFFLFMMLWESNHRQLINQWSHFIILASIGTTQLAPQLHKIADKIKNRRG